MSFSDFPVTDKTLEGVLRDLYLRSDEQARRASPPVPAALVFNGGTVAHTLNPVDFPVGITFGEADASYPGGAFGVVEVVKFADARAVQRVTYKGDVTYISATYQRSSAGVGAAWGPWIFAAGNTGWVTISSNFLDATATIKRDGDEGSLRATVRTDVPTGTSSLDVTSTGIPAHFRPPHNTFGAGYSAGVSVSALLRPDGTVAISNRNSIALTGDILITIPIMY